MSENNYLKAKLVFSGFDYDNSKHIVEFGGDNSNPTWNDFLFSYKEELQPYVVAIRECIEREGLCVLHKCDNPPCCRPEHLYSGTQADNVADRVNRGRQPRGESHPFSVLSNEEVLNIRRQFTGKWGEQTKLAAIYNVSLGMINRIVRRKTWTHI